MVENYKVFERLLVYLELPIDLCLFVPSLEVPLVPAPERRHDVDLLDLAHALDVLAALARSLHPPEALAHRHLLYQHEELLEAGLRLRVQDEEGVACVQVHRAEGQGLHEEVDVQDMQEVGRRGQGGALASTEDRTTATLGAA